MSFKLLNILQDEENSIPYRPKIAKEIGIIPAIILQQILYWYGKNGIFYKFMDKSTHELYKDGDSRCEELSMTSDMFRNNIKKIGFKLGRSKNIVSQEDALVKYYTDSNRLTYYDVNRNKVEELLEKCFSQIEEKSKDTQLTGVLPVTIVNSVLPVTIVNGKSPFTIPTEITTEITKYTAKKEISYLSLQSYKSEEAIKKRIYEFYDPDIVSKTVEKYKLLFLFINKGYDKIEDTKEGCEIFFKSMIDRSHRYGYSIQGSADWKILLIKAKEMYERAEGISRVIDNHLSTLNKFLAPKQ